MSEVRQFIENGYHVFRHAIEHVVLRDIRLFLESVTDVSDSGEYPLKARLSEELLAIPKNNDMRWILRDVLDSQELYMHMPPMARVVKPGNSVAAVPSHQDVSYNGHMSDFVTVWIPLTKIDEECGGVAVYEGSGKADRIPTWKPEDAIWLHGVNTDDYRQKKLDMEVGDVLVMNKSIIHKSMPNTSDHPRYSVDYRFFGSGQTSTKHYLDMQTFEVIAP